jgi:methyl-accepting chemotaxis protein
MIENSTAKLRDGTKLVKNAGDAMKDIVTAANRVTGMMAEIQTASSEQKEGIQQVGNAVQQMN